jgi:hypothetical protein
MCIDAIVMRSNGQDDFYDWFKTYLEGYSHRLSESFVNSDAFFFTFIVVLMIMTCLFLIPLLLLVKV